MSAPLLYAWTGEAMEPISSHYGIARRQFKVGGVYRLGIVEHRSMDSHKQFFAVINEAFANLPDEVRREIGVTSEDELRKWALTHTGHSNVTEYPARSLAEARRVMRLLKEQLSGYFRIEVNDRMLRVYEPHSMEFAKMDRRTFQRAKDDVFIVLASMLGVPIDDLIKNAGRAA